MTIKAYTNKQGEKRYKFQVYLGIDPITGKPKKTSKQGFKTRKEANLELSRIKLEAEKQLNNFKKKDYTYKEMFELWNESHSLSIKPSTQSSIDTIFKVRILPHFGKMKLTKINTFYCQKVLNQWSKEYRSFKTIRSYFNMVMNHAIRLGILDFNPMERTILPRLQVNKEVKTGRFFEVEELKRFLQYAKEDCDIRMYTILRLLAFTSIRKGECLALTWDDIDFQRKEISINKTVYYLDGEYRVSTPKTKAGTRSFDLDDITLSILKEWKHHQAKELLRTGKGAEGNKNNLLFNRMIGKKPYNYFHGSQINKAVTEICKNHDMDLVTVHSLRHSSCTLMFEAGLDIKSVQYRMGHDDVSTTLSVYSHFTKKMKQTSGEKFQKYVNF